MRRRACPLAVGLLLAAGCNSSSPSSESVSKTRAAAQPPAVPAETTQAPAESAVDEPLPTISLGGESRSEAATSSQASEQGPPATRAEIIAALQPIQVILGKWRGTTRKEVGDFKGVDDPQWVWDLRTDRDHPALVMKSTEGLYFQSARLTWLKADNRFRLETTAADGHKRVFEGTYTEPPLEFQEAGATVQRKFKLQLDEQGDTKERWQLVLNLQNNDRYLLELAKARTNDFFRFDTVGHQRDGTSFAQSDTDYGERKCIISGGLGTIQVSYQGKSYWVCCTGCEAAFKEDPEGWLKEAAKKETP
jgi:hypothetical protein